VTVSISTAPAPTAFWT